MLLRVIKTNKALELYQSELEKFRCTLSYEIYSKCGIMLPWVKSHILNVINERDKIIKDESPRLYSTVDSVWQDRVSKDQLESAHKQDLSTLVQMLSKDYDSYEFYIEELYPAVLLEKYRERFVGKESKESITNRIERNNDVTFRLLNINTLHDELKKYDSALDCYQVYVHINGEAKGEFYLNTKDINTLGRIIGNIQMQEFDRNDFSSTGVINFTSKGREDNRTRHRY